MGIGNLDEVVVSPTILPEISVNIIIIYLLTIIIFKVSLEFCTLNIYCYYFNT